MSDIRRTERNFDLTPHPRILAMLGEIVLPQWRCLAELIDNAIDAFLAAHRSGNPNPHPQVVIHLPTSSTAGSTIVIRDNGGGMDADTLERAARAGWTSNDPINNLGLFGMGFNIATARLGTRTTIWTTQADEREWTGMEVDFERLNSQESYVTPALARVKPDPSVSGTEVEISRLKPDQREWFAKSHNRSAIPRHLARVYSAMLGDGGDPIGFRLEVNGRQVLARGHCVWGGPGNEPRTVETTRHGAIDAFQSFDTRLEPRPFCQQCWNWLSAGETECASCQGLGDVVSRERRVRGWLGLQRYLDQSEFGVDLLRNGRKIEIGSKDLFKWYNEDRDVEEIEYPIDDPRGRGRIVGEVHLDHCRVPYTKDRFVREDAAFQEMVELVRGRGPLRPDIASRLGAPENHSPLYRLFQAFRRSSPHNRRMAGAWAKILVVPDNDQASAMARRFYGGDAEYRTDEKWWELIEEAEAELLGGAGEGDAATGEGDGDTLGGEDEGGAEPGGDDTDDEASAEDDSNAESRRSRIARLSTIYQDDLTSQRYELEALSVPPNDPLLGGDGTPWRLRRTTAGPWQFALHEQHSVFSSATLTPMDALLAELAWVIMDFERGQNSDYSFGQVLASLRDKYAGFAKLDPQTLKAEATASLREIARAIVGQVSQQDARALFEELSPSRRDEIQIAMASRGVQAPQDAIDEGVFLQYASSRTIVDFVRDHPEFFLDGKYWDAEYASVAYESAAAREEAQSRTLSYYLGLLTDVMWLAESDPGDTDALSRERLLRAALATELVAPNADLEDAAV